MTPKKRKEEEKFEEELKNFLRSTGRMFPETPAQVDAFERRHPKKVILPALLSDPLAILERGYILPQPETSETMNETNDSYRRAARNGLNLSADTLHKMEEDRKKAENQE